ncbi:MAG: TonB-dependent receptor plug domain-containing protein [Verrucomicrobiota bacterium]
MKSHPVRSVLLTPILLLGGASAGLAQAVSDDKKPAPVVTEGETIELSPFLVQVNTDQGYYASQTLAGGRLRQDIKDIGTSIQVVTKEFLDDLSVTGIEDLLQYTTGTEVGGITGNFMGAADNAGGETSTGESRRNPDGTSRVRGLAAPDRSRNFFKTDIAFDSYNTDRIDINRGANSFLFGLGSPAGLINNGLIKARFRDTNEISTRIGSGGKNPSYRGSFNLNRVLIKDKVAVFGAVLMDRTQYRQEPTYKDDDRQYATITFRPFKNADTVITAHVENGRIRGTAPDVLLPQSNLGTFINDPANARVSINAYGNLQRFAHVEGPTQAQWNALSAEEKLKYRVRETPNASSLSNANWGNGAYGLVFDGTNGKLPAFAYTDQYRAADYIAGDPFFGPGRTTKGGPFNVYHGNLSEIGGVGWLDQGFTNLDTFDFSKSNLGWDNDYYTRDFVNYNVALEQVLFKGKAGFEIALDYQDLFKRDFVAFNGPNAEIVFDINETLWLPTDPNYRTSGVVAPMPNPNYGRPFVLTKPSSRTTDTQREAGRFTAFAKFNFEEKAEGRWFRRFVGNHTITGMADKSQFDEKVVNYNLTSFGDPEPALHIGPPNARQSSNAPRNVPLFSYIGPQQLQAFTDPNFGVADFVLTPAKYTLRPPPDYSIRKLSWNLGPDANNSNFGLDSRVNGNEGFVFGNFTPYEVPNKNYRLQRTKVTSYALNTQSFFWEHLLVVNFGYRHDVVKTQLNTEAPIVGLDEISDVSPEGFRLENGTSTQIKSDIAGYGGVLNWPNQWIRLPWGVKASLHYNTSENFVPATDRVDAARRPVPSPSGTSKDWGITLSTADNKLNARFNWFTSKIIGATSNVSELFNQTNTNIFNHYGNLNRDIMRYDANGDGRIDDSFYNEVPIDPATGLTPEGLNRDQAIAQLFPGFGRLRAARDSIAPHLTDELRTAYNYRMQPDGTSQTQFAGNITDTNDIESKGFEAEIVFNPTRAWRLAFNAARQETINTNIAPALTKLLENTWLPHLAQFGNLDWDNPAQPVAGNTVVQQVNDRLLDYYATKGQEGRPQAEQRKWRFNLITRYQIGEGKLRGFSIGGAARWEDRYAGGYPIINDPRGIILPDIYNPYRVDSELSYDLTFGYRRRIFGNRDWTAQLNIRNLQNLSGDEVTAVRFQPDGSVARVRYDPPLQIFLTNTVKF